MAIRKCAAVAVTLILLLAGIVRTCAGQDVCPLPGDTLLLFNAAIAAHDSGMTDTALARMTEFIREFQGSPAPYYILGNWYHESGDREQAKKFWAKARSAQPG